MVSAWLSLGGNQGDSRHVFTRAIDAIRQLPKTRLDAVSPLYETPPWGDEAQPPFHNAVLKVRTALEPEAFLRKLQEIELDLGRLRDPARQWGPRIIDIDILLFGDVCMDTRELTLPHPRLSERAFVLLPLVELEPELPVPGLGLARRLLAGLSAEGIRRVADPGWEIGT